MAEHYTLKTTNADPESGSPGTFKDNATLLLRYKGNDTVVKELKKAINNTLAHIGESA